MTSNNVVYKTAFAIGYRSFQPPQWLCYPVCISDNGAICLCWPYYLNLPLYEDFQWLAYSKGWGWGQEVEQSSTDQWFDLWPLQSVCHGQCLQLANFASGRASGVKCPMPHHICWPDDDPLWWPYGEQLKEKNSYSIYRLLFVCSIWHCSQQMSTNEDEKNILTSPVNGS